MTKIRRAAVALACVSAAGGLLWAIGHLRTPAETLLWAQLMNFGHVPLFAALASCVLGLCVSLLGDGMPRQRIYVVALAWALVLGGASEALQVLEDRDVAAWDFLRNALGAASALALWASVDRRLEVGPAWPRWRRSLRALAVLAVVAAFVPVALTVESYRRMKERGPVLFRFDSALELPFVRPRDASLRLVRAPAAWTEYAGRRVGRVTFRPSGYPSLLIYEFHRDWEEYEFLEWNMFLPDDREVEVVLRIEDVWHDGRLRDRFNARIPLRPGPTRLRIPLRDVRGAPESREMDMSAVKAVILFVALRDAPVSLFVADLKLVGPSASPGG